MGLVKGYLQAFTEIISLLTRHRNLTWEITKREISDRYSGQVLGLLWAIVHPLFLMGLYVFIFGFVFKMKIGGTMEMPLDYTTYLMSGLVAWMGCQEAMIKSCSAITGHAALVKQVVFPLEVLPVKGVLAALFTQSVSLAALILYVFVTHGWPPLTYLLVPVLLLFQVMAMIGVGYFLAPISAYFRDTKDFVQLFSIAGLYLMPVFYLPTWVPGLFKPLLYFNPFSYLIWCYQDALYYGRFEHPWAWVVIGVLSVVVFVLGYRVFRKLKPLLGNFV